MKMWSPLVICCGCSNALCEAHCVKFNFCTLKSEEMCHFLVNLKIISIVVLQYY